ncbi:MAG: M28 family peptidase [Bacteroidales bacterium]|nr:M28 family peptidase [Bacteroidales bacterium]
MKKISIGLLFGIFLNTHLIAQDTTYARHVVSHLASQEMKGRGYVDNGDKKAANFIASEYSKFGLQSFSNKYFQEFDISVNTFPKEMKLVVNNKELQPGYDYITDAASKGIKGKYNPVWIDKNELLDKNILVNKIQLAENGMLVVDNRTYDQAKDQEVNEILKALKYSPEIKIEAVAELTTQKLMWNASTYTLPRCYVSIQADSVTIDTIYSIDISIQNTFFSKYQTQNVAGYIQGTSQPDSFIVFTAHYDHLGMMGQETYFPGANDNASGIAMLLNLAKYYSQYPPHYSIVFIALGAEEVGLLGAKYFSENPLFNLENIKFLINFDLAGTGDLGIQVVNGKVYRKEFDLLCQINEQDTLLPQVKIRGEACNSDHCMFYMKGVPCFYIYTLGGINAYHDVNDKAETLPLTEFSDYQRLILRFVDKLK